MRKDGGVGRIKGGEEAQRKTRCWREEESFAEGRKLGSRRRGWNGG